MSDNDEWDQFADEIDRDDDEDGDFDCMMMADGLCMAAGSEWCDFECPMRDR